MLYDQLSEAQQKALKWLAITIEGASAPARHATLRALAKAGYAYFNDERQEWDLTEAGRLVLYQNLYLRKNKASDFRVGQKVRFIDWLPGKGYYWRAATVGANGNRRVRLDYTVGDGSGTMGTGTTWREPYNVDVVVDEEKTR